MSRRIHALHVIKKTHRSPSRCQHEIIPPGTKLSQDIPFQLAKIPLSLTSKNIRYTASGSFLHEGVQIPERDSLFFGQFPPERGLATRHIPDNEEFHNRQLLEVQLHLRLVTQHIGIRDFEIDIRATFFRLLLFPAI